MFKCIVRNTFPGPLDSMYLNACAQHKVARFARQERSLNVDCMLFIRNCVPGDNISDYSETSALR